MKIGIHNIFTSFWFVLVILCGGSLTYLAMDKNLFTGDLIIIAKFFVGLFMLFTAGILIYLLRKFRVLLITDKKIISIHTFLIKREIINRNDIKQLKLENISAFRETVYRILIIKDSERSLNLSDLEFENFEHLISDLNYDVDKKREIDLIQAKSNLSNMSFNIYLLSGFLIFLVINTIGNSGFHLISLTFFICPVILLYASLKRKIKYKRLIKTASNHR